MIFHRIESDHFPMVVSLAFLEESLEPVKEVPALGSPLVYHANRIRLGSVPLLAREKLVQYPDIMDLVIDLVMGPNQDNVATLLAKTVDLVVVATLRHLAVSRGPTQRFTNLWFSPASQKNEANNSAVPRQ